ncbi:MAG: HAD family phosphatase [Sediminibacterium sp.]
MVNELKKEYMTPQIKAIIFDLDGVIIDSNPVIEAFWQSWADKEGIQLNESLIREWIHGRTGEDTINGLFTHSSDAVKKEIKTGGTELGVNMKPFPINGLIPFVKKLAAMQAPTGVVTSSNKTRMQQMLSHLLIQDYFTGFITAEDVSKGKPDPEPYVKMSRKLQLPPDHCLVFEDAVSGLLSAKAAGMHAIGIGDALVKEKLLSAGAADVVIDFTQLTLNKEYLVTVNGTGFQLI